MPLIDDDLWAIHKQSIADLEAERDRLLAECRFLRRRMELAKAELRGTTAEGGDAEAIMEGALETPTESTYGPSAESGEKGS